MLTRFAIFSFVLSILSNATFAAPECQGELTFAGIGQFPLIDGDREKPPDTHIAVGHGQGKAGRLIETTNNGLQMFAKDGTTVSEVVSLENFVGAPVNTCFDAKVIYDLSTARFFVVMPQGKDVRSSSLNIAVSKTSAPVDLHTDWQHYKFAETSGKRWLDYPCPGTSSEHLVVTTNLKDQNAIHRGSRMDVLDKRKLIAGQVELSTFVFEQEKVSGTFTVQPAHCISEAGCSTTLISRCSAEEFRLWQIKNAGGKPVVTSTVFDWAGGAQVRAGAPQGSSEIKIQTCSGRIMNSVHAPNGVWCCQSSDFNADGHSEVGVFKILLTENSRGKILSGIIPQDNKISWDYIPSVGVDSGGAACMVYSMSSANNYPQMLVRSCVEAAAGLEFGKPLLIAESVGEYDDVETHNPEKWGDYAACVPDPDEPGVFWVAHETCVSGRKSGDDSGWGTTIAKVRLIGK